MADQAPGEVASAKPRRTVGRSAANWVAVLAFLVGAGAAFVLSAAGVADPLLARLGRAQSTASDAATRAAPHFYTLPEILVNLTASGAKPSYVKVRLVLELGRGGDTEAIEVLMPRLLDSFQAHLRGLGPDDLAGSAGMESLRVELLSRAVAEAPDGGIRDLLFEEILVQ